MSSGAFALYIDQQAGAGPSAVIHRVVPLPPISNQDGIHFDHRRLTLAYDPLNNNPPTLTVTGRFLGVNVPINLTIGVGCHNVPIPANACAASFEVQPTPPHGTLTALVEYNS